MDAIIGREKEIAELNELYHSDKSEFVAVYGRRRVGKTFLVDEAWAGAALSVIISTAKVRGGTLVW